MDSKPTVFKIYIWKTNRPTFLGRIIADGQHYMAPLADLPATGIEARQVDQPGVLRKRVGGRNNEEARVLRAIQEGCATSRDIAKKTLLTTEKCLRLCYRMETRGLIKRAGFMFTGDSAKNYTHVWRLS